MYHENTGKPFKKGLPRLSKPPCPWQVKRFPCFNGQEERSKDGKYRF
nr:MAG TPA: hypothetical protein [Caudoviricetes sp.]